MKKEFNLHLYAVTDRHWLRGRTLASQVREVLEGGATIVQICLLYTSPSPRD